MNLLQSQWTMWQHQQQLQQQQPSNSPSSLSLLSKNSLRVDLRDHLQPDVSDLVLHGNHAVVSIPVCHGYTAVSDRVLGASRPLNSQARLKTVKKRVRFVDVMVNPHAVDTSPSLRSPSPPLYGSH